MSLTEIVKQVRDGVLWVLDYALDRKASVVLCGHSVGSQLTFMALASPAAQSRCSPVSASLIVKKVAKYLIPFQPSKIRC